MQASFDNLRQIVESFTGKKVLVLGDAMLDEYLWGSVSRISPEAPVMVVDVARTSWNPGGAANVAANVAHLGGEAKMVAVVGDDEAADRLCREMESRGIGAEGIVRDPARPTTIKTRIIAHSQQVVRIDREERAPLSDAVARQLRSVALDLVDWADAVVVSDYDKGVIPACCAEVTQRAMGHGAPVTSNPKPNNLKLMRGGTLCSLNNSEAEAASGRKIIDGESLAEAGKAVRRIAGTKWAAITRGEHGISLFGGKGGVLEVPGIPVAVYDVAGAGDSVIAVMTLALASGADAKHAAILANFAGATVVRRVGVAAASQQDILNLCKESGVHG